MSVDLENGYGGSPESAAEAIVRVAEAGAVGGSIEDYDPAGRLYEPGQAAERVAAAAEFGAGRRLPVHAHRPRREPHPRQPRPRRHDRPTAGVRGGRRRLPLRARPANGRRDTCGLRRGLRPLNVLALRGCRSPSSPTPGRSASASEAGSRGWRSPRSRRRRVRSGTATSPRSRCALPLREWFSQG